VFLLLHGYVCDMRRLIFQAKDLVPRDVYDIR
jgi:hypothetical protein